MPPALLSHPSTSPLQAQQQRRSLSVRCTGDVWQAGSS